MSTKYIASNWRLPNQENSSKSDNYGLTFDGNSERIEIPFTKLNGATNCTISFWAKINYSVDSEPKYPLTLTSGTDFDIMWIFGANGTSLDVYIGNVNFRLDGSFNNDIDEWNHWVLRFDGSQSSGNRTKIYQNGQQLTSEAGWGTATSIPTASHLIIGGRNLGSTAWFYQFPGSISDISIFDYTLTESQISTLYGSSSLGAGNPMAIKRQPVGYWPLGDNSASNPLTQPNEAVEDASVFNFVESSSQYIDIGTNNSVLMPTDEMSISLWVKFSAAAMGNTRGLFSANSATGYNGYVIWKDNNDKISFLINDGSWKIASGPTVVQDTWYHVVATWDGSTARIYVDNVDEGNVSVSSIVYNASTVNRIGDYANDEMDGNMANVQFWNTGLSASDVSTLYNSGVPLYTGTQPQEANLKAWYKLNNTANWEADSSGDWQIPDAVSAYPQSFDFDGSTQFINAGSTSYLNNATQMSCSIWFNIDVAAQNDGLIADYSFGGAGHFALYTKSASGNDYTFRLSVPDSTADDNRIQIDGRPFTAGNWHNLIFTYNAGTVLFYADGSLVSATAVGSETIPTSLRDSTGTLSIGEWQGINLHWDGKISNAQIWTTELSASQVETLYNNGSPLTTAIASDNLKLWAKLDNNEKFDGTNWSVENQKYPVNYDSALSFPASDDYISIGSTTLGINTAIAISAWVKTSVNTGYGAIINEDNAGNKRNWHLLRKNDDIFFTIYHDAAGTNKTNITTSTINVSDNEWHHVVGTWDGTTNADSMKVYFDGVEVAQATPSSTGINTEAAAPWIGNATDNPSGYFNWTGELSNIAIYNTNLDSSAVTALYNNGTPETSISSSPVSWWKLNNLTTGIQDSAGSNDGTNNGATKVNTFVSTEAGTSSGMTEQNLVNNNVSVLNGASSGMTSANLVLSDLSRSLPYGDGYSFIFDKASTDYINCGNSTDFDFTTQITISAWVKTTDQDSINNIVKKDDGASNRGWNLSWRGSSGGGSRLVFWNWSTDGTYNYLYTTGTPASNFADDNWHHVVATYDGTADANGAKIYLDGVLMSQGAVSRAGTGLKITTEPVEIGDGIDAKITNVSLFDEELTSTEVLKLYSNGVPQNLENFNPQPVAFYPLGSNSFWNGSQWTVRDMIGSNDGTGQNIGVDGLVGDAPRSEANGTGTNMDIPTNLEGSTKWSSNNSWSINMSETARVEDTP